MVGFIIPDGQYCLMTGWVALKGGYSTLRNFHGFLGCQGLTLPKTNIAHGKSTILMVFTRKHGDFHGRAVSLQGGQASLTSSHSNNLTSCDRMRHKSLLSLEKAIGHGWNWN